MTSDTAPGAGGVTEAPASRYHGITHMVPYRALGLWRRLMCSRGVHAFDEVFHGEGNHLSCDACHLHVDVVGVDYTYVKGAP